MLERGYDVLDDDGFALSCKPSTVLDELFVIDTIVIFSSVLSLITILKKGLKSKFAILLETFQINVKWNKSTMVLDQFGWIFVKPWLV